MYKKLLAATFVLLLLNTPAYSQATSFGGSVCGAPKTLSVTAASSNVQLSINCTVAIVWNIGTTEAFVKFGSTSAAAVAATTDDSIPAGSFKSYNVGISGLFVAAITASSTTTIRVGTYQGSPYSGGGGAGGGGGSVTQGTSPWVDNISQFGGSNVVTGAGAGGAGIPRVTVSNDSTIINGAGEAHIGEVGGNILPITNTPTTSASTSVTTGKSIGGLLTLANAVRVSGSLGAGGTSGILQSVMLTFKDAIGTVPFDVYYFNASPTGSTCTDNTTFALVDADRDKVIFIAHVTDITASNTAAIAQAGNMAIPFGVASATSIFACVVTRGTAALGTGTANMSLITRILRN